MFSFQRVKEHNNLWKDINKKNTHAEKLTLKEFFDTLYQYELFPFQVKLISQIYSSKGVVMLLATRGIGKTDLITALLTLYKVYINPLERVLIITNRSTRGKNILFSIGAYIKNNMDIFKDVFNEEDINLTGIRTKLNKDKGVSIGFASLGSDIRGDRPTNIVFDDILTMETSHHAIKRKNALIKYQEATSLCKNILIIGNATHEQDLYSELKQASKVKILEIYNDYTDLPEIFKIDKEEKLSEGISNRTIMANYFGTLVSDESTPFSEVMVMTNTAELPNSIELLAFYDFANGGADFNSLAIVFIHNFKAYIVGINTRGMWSDFITQTQPLLKELDIKNVYYETNGVGREPNKVFDSINVNSFGKRTILNKGQKIASLYPYIKDLILIKNENIKGNIEFINNFKGYSPSGTCHDDANDSVAMALIQLGFIGGKK
jgi:hypothetical protein